MYYSHVRGGDQREPVIDHLCETGEMAAEFARVFHADDWAKTLGMWHDIGKYSVEFQRRLLENGPRVDHSTAAAFELDKQGLSLLAYCAAGHHGGLPDGGTGGELAEGSTLTGRLYKAKNGEIPEYEAYRSELEFAIPQTPRLFSENIPPSEQCYSLAFLTRMIFSCLVDADYLCTERFINCVGREVLSTDSPKELSEKLESKISKFYPATSRLNEMRCSILDACAATATEKPGVFSLTVPTGGGKTYASMRFALQHAAAGSLAMRRVIYAVPYTTIIQQNAAVFREVLGEENVLEHHANFDFNDQNEEGSALRLATENWDAPVIVTTNVQFFESLYANKTSRCRKLHNIAGSVIVLDEAQMLPTKQLLPCIRALAELVKHYNCTVVLCTATQPSLNEFFAEYGCPVREITPDPVELAERFRRVMYCYIDSLDDEQLANRLKEDHQALCIVNSRKQAKRVYDLIKGDDSFHLSTLMHPVHRDKVLQEIRDRLSNGRPCRVVSTSLIEAGVDVDFPVAYRAIAGIDSMVQASGRVNRNGKKTAVDSLVYLFEPAERYALPADLVQKIAVSRGLIRKIIESSRLADKTAICESGTKEVPCDIGSLDVITEYFEELYGLRAEDLDAAHVLLSLSSYRTPHSIPFADAAHRFRMIEEGSLTVVIPDQAISIAFDAARNGNVTRDTMRSLARYSVTVYERELDALVRSGAVEAMSHGVYVLMDISLYKEDTGLDFAVEEGKGLFF